MGLGVICTSVHSDSHYSSCRSHYNTVRFIWGWESARHLLLPGWVRKQVQHCLSVAKDTAAKLVVCPIKTPPRGGGGVFHSLRPNPTSLRPNPTSPNPETPRE
jgi:hypothetical protein